MVAQVACRPRPCLQLPASPRVVARLARPGRRLRPGSLAWWLHRLADPQDLLGLKVALTVAVFVAGGLIGP